MAKDDQKRCKPDASAGIEWTWELPAETNNELRHLRLRHKCRRTNELFRVVRAGDATVTTAEGIALSLS